MEEVGQPVDAGVEDGVAAESGFGTRLFRPMKPVVVNYILV